MGQTSPAVLGPVQPSVRPHAPRFACTWCSQCGASLGPGDSGVSHCTDHNMETKIMSTDITPRKQAAIPQPERISTVTLSGCEFVVGWGCEKGEPETYCDGYVSDPGIKPAVWVDCVKLDGKWWDAGDVFSSDFCDQLDAALYALEEFGASA